MQNFVFYKKALIHKANLLYDILSKSKLLYFCQFFLTKSNWKFKRDLKAR